MPIGMVIRAKHIHTGPFCQHVLFKTDRFVFSAVMTDIMRKKKDEIAATERKQLSNGVEGRGGPLTARKEGRLRDSC